MSKTETPEASPTPNKNGGLDVYKYRWLFLGISIAFLIPGLFYIVSNMMNPEIQAPVRLGIDFRGGTMLEYGFSKRVTQEDTGAIREAFDKAGYTGSVVQIQEPRAGINKSDSAAPQPDAASETEPATKASAPAGQVGSAPSTGSDDVTKDAHAPGAASHGKADPATGSTASATKGAQPSGKTIAHETKASSQGALQTPAPVAAEEQVASVQDEAAGHGENIANIVSIRSKHIQGHDDEAILKDLKARFGPITLLQKNSIGPSLAQELLVNGLLALGLAYLLIVGYLTFRFQFDFAVCAMIALVHDTIFLFGMFALFGALFHTEVDSLFITSVLTVVGFSVHDTIVVFDRIRENMRVLFTKKVPFVEIVNRSVNETLTRSINTSLTVLLTMLALYFFGGETTKDFVLAIIIGIAAGTYSSIFNASVLLAMWRNRTQPASATA